MNLHVFYDELGHYLTESVSRIEKLQPGKNLFYNLKSNTKHKHPSVIFFDFSKKEVRKRIESLPRITKVFFHFYTIENTFILDRLKEKNPDLISVWILWSADLYHLPMLLPNLYEEFSKKYLPTATLKRRVYRLLLKLRDVLTGKMIFNTRRYLASLRQIDFIASLLQHDYQNAVELIGNKVPRIQFAYLSYEQMIPAAILHELTAGNKIMVNHSADPSLNHYEVLQQLKKQGVENPIYLPLAYGVSSYKNEIIQVAKELFGEQAEIQDTFIEKHQYTMQLRQVGFAIFNIKIQQGIANILVLLWLGVKVFLREENSVYKDFKSWGLYLYSVQQDLPMESFRERLTEEQVRHNRDILEAKLSNSKIDEYYLNLLNVKQT